MGKIEQFTECLTKRLMSFDIGQNSFGYVYPQGNVTNISKIDTLLKKAGGKPKDCDLNDFSKGGSGKAKPEFIVTFKDDTTTIMIIECKKQTRYHESEKLNKPKQYALDGALYYAKFLKQDYNVIVIGVSGTDKDKSISDVYYWQKKQEIPNKQQKLHNIFLTADGYLKAIKGEKITKQYSLDEIRATALIFHEKLREIKLTEKQKPIFIAGILIALEDKDFLNSYNNLPSFKSIITQLNQSIETVLNNSDIRKENIENVRSAFKLIASNPKLKEIQLNLDGSIRWYIEQLEMKIRPMMNNADYSLDALGVFYHEFVKYSGGDGSGLGIVLTPQHLTEFMCNLAGVSKNSRVVDICCGSGSFLITAMNKMFNETVNTDELSEIRKNHLYGIELDQDLYILAIANMIIRKDGKSNILHGDCFNKNIIKELRRVSDNKIDVGLLNPPYSQKDKEELEFVEQLLSIIAKGGKAVVVVPMSCAIGTRFKETRKRLFEKHTLSGVFSMPDDIFYPTGTNVCVMIWEPHKPHDATTKTYFGYYKTDGFMKRKKLGRVDVGNKWENIQNEWLKLYKNSEIVDGFSTKKCVSYNDEWLAEAYMNTDYSQIKDEIFERKIREYLSYLIQYGINDLKNTKNNKKNIINLKDKKVIWQDFKLSILFVPERGARLTKEDRFVGNIPLVTAGDQNLGVKMFISNKEQKKYSNKITIDMFCNSYVHIDTFCCDDNIITLDPRHKISKYSMLFISAIIELDKYRYQYGRQYRMKNFKSHTIKLPLGINNLPNWKLMEKYIRSLPYCEFF